MPSPVLANLEAAGTRSVSAMQAATVALKAAATELAAVPAKIQAAVEAALANGATAEELAPFQNLADDLTSEAFALVAATPPAPTPPPAPPTPTPPSPTP